MLNTSTAETFSYPVILFLYIVYLIWSLKLREERRLRVSENRVLRRIFGLKRDVVTGEWRGLHNKKLNDLNSAPDILVFRVIESRRMRWARHVTRLGKRRGAYRVLVWIPERNRTLRRSRRRWRIILKCIFNTWDGEHGLD
jgi:hypothetical protein